MNELISINTISAIILNHLWELIDSYQEKVTWFQAKELFHKRFTGSSKKCCHSEHFVKKEKRWKSLSVRSGEYSGWSRIDQPKNDFFFSEILSECDLVFSWKSIMFFLMTGLKHFFIRFLST